MPVREVPNLGLISYCGLTNKNLYYNYRSVAELLLIGGLPVTLKASVGGAAVSSCSGVT